MNTLVSAASIASASAVPASAAGASTTLPPDLIERFVSVRAWYLDYHRREQAFSGEVDRQFYAATGVTAEQYHEMNYETEARERIKRSPWQSMRRS
jgi:hypothetical protein